MFAFAFGDTFGEQRLHLQPGKTAWSPPLYHLSSLFSIQEFCSFSKLDSTARRSFDFFDFLRMIRNFNSPFLGFVSQDSGFVSSASENNRWFCCFLLSILYCWILACRFDRSKNFVLSSVPFWFRIRVISRCYSSVTTINPSKLTSGARWKFKDCRKWLLRFC